MRFGNGFHYPAVRDGWESEFLVHGRNPDGTYDIQWLDGSIQCARRLDLQEWVEAYEALHKK